MIYIYYRIEKGGNKEKNGKDRNNYITALSVRAVWRNMDTPDRATPDLPEMQESILGPPKKKTTGNVAIERRWEMNVETFNYQFKGMNKPDSFIVYPAKVNDKTLTVQGSRTIAQFDIETGKGVLNFKGSNSKYFMHLNKMLGAIEYDFPKDFIIKCLEYLPKSGDLIGSSSITGPVYLA